MNWGKSSCRVRFICRHYATNRTPAYWAVANASGSYRQALRASLRGASRNVSGMPKQSLLTGCRLSIKRLLRTSQLRGGDGALFRVKTNITTLLARHFLVNKLHYIPLY